LFASFYINDGVSSFFIVVLYTETEIHTAEPLVPEPSSSEVEIAIEKLKRYKSPGID
jgi:hypothetical protein